MHEGKNQRLVRIFIQDKFSEGLHPTRVRVKIVSSILFQDPVSRKRENTASEKSLNRERLRSVPPRQKKTKGCILKKIPEPLSVVHSSSPFIKFNDHLLMRR